QGIRSLVGVGRGGPLTFQGAGVPEAEHVPLEAAVLPAAGGSVQPGGVYLPPPLEQRPAIPVRQQQPPPSTAVKPISIAGRGHIGFPTPPNHRELEGRQESRPARHVRLPPARGGVPSIIARR